MRQLVEAAVGSELGPVAATVGVLSAMITPAVLISACGSLAISTSNRLGRTIERTRKLREQFAALARAPAADGDPALAEQVGEEIAMLFGQLERATRRSRLLQRAMTRIYLAIGVFVATSVAVGLVAVTHARFTWIPVMLGLAGAGLLFNASALLIIESRVALAAIEAEMAFVWRTGQRLAPADLATLASRVPREWWKRRRR